MRHCIKRFLISICIWGCVNALNGQIFLQLERYNNPKSLKFYTGDNLEFKLKDYPDVWRNSMLIDLKHDQQLLVFPESFYHTQDIHSIRLRYPWVKSMGNKFMQFSGVWFIYGGIASLVDDEFSIGDNEIYFGASFALTGFLMRTLFYKKKIKLNKRRRLRVMDVSFKKF